MKKNSGWSGYWSEFLNIEKQEFIHTLIQYVNSLEWTQSVSESQILAWNIEFDVMQCTLQEVLRQGHDQLQKAWISFEHELFGESGKRAADVNLVLPTGDLFLIEFKHKVEASQQEITRVGFDLSSLLKFHSESISLKGHAYLALTKNNAKPFEDHTVICDVAQNNVLHILKEDLIAAGNKPEVYQVENWQSGGFIRQPGILAGTVGIFFNHKMPNLKNEAAENINEAREELLQLYEDAKASKSRFIVMVNGRPGAGKTLLGMTVVAELARQYKHDGLSPLFISGNDPLVEVLRYTLDYYGKQKNQFTDIDGRVIIEQLINFKRTFRANKRVNDHLENYIFFDEAQRAWDHIGYENNEPESELHLLCRWLSKKEFGVLVLLIGDGQAIHNKEMSIPEFMTKFNDAIFKYGQDFQVIMPSLHAHYCQGYHPIEKDIFNLKTPIRQHYTDQLDMWIEAVLQSNSSLAFDIAKTLDPYPLYITRSKEAAENYAHILKKELHEDERQATKFRMGWLESSKGAAPGKNLLPQISKGKNQIGPWYVHQPDDKQSCCSFNTSSTEFSSQGLEISLALLNWGNDLVFSNGQLVPQEGKRQKDEYTFGAYRVLLSRGKNGLIIKADDPETFEYLKKCGMSVLA